MTLSAIPRMKKMIEIWGQRENWRVEMKVMMKRQRPTEAFLRQFASGDRAWGLKEEIKIANLIQQRIHYLRWITGKQELSNFDDVSALHEATKSSAVRRRWKNEEEKNKKGEEKEKQTVKESEGRERSKTEERRGENER